MRREDLDTPDKLLKAFITIEKKLAQFYEAMKTSLEVVGDLDVRVEKLDKALKAKPIQEPTKAPKEPPKAPKESKKAPKKGAYK